MWRSDVFSAMRTIPRGKILPVSAAILALALLAAAVWFFRPGGWSRLEGFPSADYRERPADFLGNTYVLRAQIDKQIRWERDLGRLLAVSPESGGGRLPVFVPAAISDNLHVGQRYAMRVRVGEGGLVYVEDLRKF